LRQSFASIAQMVTHQATDEKGYVSRKHQLLCLKYKGNHMMNVMQTSKVSN